MRLVTRWAKIGKDKKDRDMFQGSVEVDMKGPPDLVREIDSAIREKITAWPYISPSRRWQEYPNGSDLLEKRN